MDMLKETINVAKEAGCDEARCGSIIVIDDEIIGRGFNSPPKDLESQRRCNTKKDGYDPKVTDKTCCVHAEQRAIMDAMRRNPEKINGSTLYFIRLDEKGNPTDAGKPYCTICSKMALDSGVKWFALWYGEWKLFDTEEYNKMSYEYDNSSHL